MNLLSPKYKQQKHEYMATKTEKNIETYLPDIVAIVLFAVSILILLSLISYSETDPSIITASSQKTKNWIGIIGANTAALIFSIVGYIAYTIPFLTALIAWKIFQSKTLLPTKTKVLGFLIFILSAPTLLNIFDGYGAMIGTFLGGILINFLGKVGSSILLFAFIIISFLLITDASSEAISKGIKFAFESIALNFKKLLERYKQWKEEERKRAKERLERRKKIRAENNEDNKAEDTKPILIENALQPTEETSAELKSPIILSSNKLEALDEVSTNESKEALTYKESSQDEFNSPQQVEATIEEVKKEIKQSRSEINNQKGKQNFENYVLPSTDYLTPPSPHFEQKEEELLETAKQIVEKTKEFNVTGRVVHICQGPVVTTYEFKPDPGIKYSRIVSLADDLCLALKAESIRIDRIPGKAYVGIEVPNKRREVIYLREIIESKKFRESESLLTIALGKTIDGANYVTDLAKMPHLLIAGATGSGKSVGVNSLIVSILYKAKPNEVKFIMVDPKRLELGVYADIPHLATPIITDPKRASVALKWAVSEMERRYKHLAGWGVRNIDGYNEEVKRRNEEGDFDENGEPWKSLPYIVIIIDEFADLMMVSGNEVEEAITRLAQMARAVGIHLVLATQRPSVDVITGLIKANFPARISFRVSSKVDSRTVIDMNGAEKLLGKGDMLFLPPATSQIVRVHGAFVEEKEIFKIVQHIKSQGEPEYDVTITKTEEELEDPEGLPGRNDPLFWDALRVIVNAKKASTSLLQRHLRIGYGRAAAILDAMVRAGYVGEMDASARARPVLPAAYQALQEWEQQES